ncbi:hypothetical protein, partial [Mycobacterium gordonae]
DRWRTSPHGQIRVRHWAVLIGHLQAVLMSAHGQFPMSIDSGLLAAGLAIGTAPSAGAQCGVDWINQQTCDNIMREYMVGQNFDVYLSYLVPDPNDRAAVRDYLWHSRI